MLCQFTLQKFNARGLSHAVLVVAAAILPFSLQAETVALDTAASQTAKTCDEFTQGDVRLLRSKDSIDLCQFSGRPLLIVNTASHCGYTPQFEGLERLHKAYADQGLVVLGFPSDDFNQEAATEEKTADICYVNYGVSFTMLSPVGVKGAEAHPVFAHLAEQTQSPSWNFNKYVVSADRERVQHFSSKVAPEDAALVSAIEAEL